MFTVHHDDRKRLISSVRAGFFDLEEVSRYREAMTVALATATRAGDFTLLIDISAAQPLAADVAKRFERVAADIRASTVRRVAFVSPGAVNRIQVRRISQANADPRFQIFENTVAAKAWLDGD